MALRYVLDEHLRQALWWAVVHHNLRGISPIDVVRVGDPPDLPLGTADPDLLLWAEREGRILISRDVRTLPIHLADHLAAGHRSPGIFFLRPRSSLAQRLNYLVLAAHASDETDWDDRAVFIP